MNYYNGIVFKGFIKGIPAGILSGGQYDKLMKKLGKRSKAIGFAVYLDMLEELIEDDSEYDIDTVLLYDDSSDISQIESAIKNLTVGGESVTAQRSLPEKIRCRRVLSLQNGEVRSLENNA